MAAKNKATSTLKKNVSESNKCTHQETVNAFLKPRPQLKVPCPSNGNSASVGSSMVKNMSGIATDKDICQETVDAFSRFGLQMNCLKIPLAPANDNNTSEATSMMMESSVSEAESISLKDRSKKHRKHPQKDAAAKRVQTGVRMPSASNPSPDDGDNVPSDSGGEPPGAKENVEEFQEQDGQIAKMIEESWMACHTQDLATNFLDIIDDNGHKYQICWVCK